LNSCIEDSFAAQNAIIYLSGMQMLFAIHAM
jgi:hypothetical protein